MTLNAAMKRLAREKEFLGVTWGKLFSLFKESPGMFPNGANEAFEVYRRTVEEGDRS
jgi:hypothetical protein